MLLANQTPKRFPWVQYTFLTQLRSLLIFRCIFSTEEEFFQRCTLQILFFSCRTPRLSRSCWKGALCAAEPRCRRCHLPCPRSWAALAAQKAAVQEHRAAFSAQQGSCRHCGHGSARLSHCWSLAGRGTSPKLSPAPRITSSVPAPWAARKQCHHGPFQGNFSGEFSKK